MTALSVPVVREAIRPNPLPFTAAWITTPLPTGRPDLLPLPLYPYLPRRASGFSTLSPRRPERALIRPSPGPKMFGDCLAMVLSGALWRMLEPGRSGRQESCQVGGELAEGQRDKSLMINGGWLRGVALNHRHSGYEPEGPAHSRSWMSWAVFAATASRGDAAVKETPRTALAAHQPVGCGSRRARFRQEQERRPGQVPPALPRRNRDVQLLLVTRSCHRAPFFGALRSPTGQVPWVCICATLVVGCRAGDGKDRRGRLRGGHSACHEGLDRAS